METFSTDIYEIWAMSKNIVISTHLSPDGDAVGAVMALAMAVSEIGAKPIVLIENYAEKFDFIKGKEYIFDGDYDTIEPDVFIAVDCGAKKRLGKAESVFERAKTTFNIDHHISNNNFADNNIVLGGVSSSCEVVFEIIKNFCTLDKYMAEALYTGIVTDTFGFKYNSTSKKTMEIGGGLIDFGIDYSSIQDKVLYEHTKTEVEIFKKALENLKFEGRIAYTYLTSEDLKKCGATSKDLDGIVEYILNIKDMEISAFIYEKDENLCKISLRSKSADVNKIASIFDGGGHMLAAGASIKGDLNSVISYVLTEIKKELKSDE
ncbi:MAG: bifunctional oligoribonuclease/PAP phosphatase NrnA [Clostridiales bacterium]|nr:bifunctional oligoribonuclease/PAP phosphatase NrnA [Clostridiales bacterium]